MTGVQKDTYKVRYVYVEMILNKETKYDVIAGLFRGIVEKDGSNFILLHGLKGATAALNMDFYNIMSVEVLEDDYKYMTYLTCETSDQELAFQMLDELYADLMKYDFGVKDDPTIIDIEKYKEVPKDYLDGKPVNKSTAQAGSNATAGGVGSFANNQKTYSRNNSVVGFGTTNARKEPKPATFGRSKTKKPTKTALETMQEKLDQIKAGQFEPQLPETMGDEEGATPAVDPEEDEYGNFGLYHGMSF